MSRALRGAMWVCIGVFSVIGSSTQADAQLCCPIKKSQTTTLEGTAAPALALTDLQGKEVSLADLKGKVVVLNFWKGGLLGAEGQIPQLNKLQARYGTEKVRVVGVAMDERAKTAAGNLMKEKGLDCEVLLGDKQVGEQCSLASLPATLIIDQEGVVAKQYDGRIAVEQVEEQVKALLLGGKEVETPGS
ncbi:MAG: TlpA family protein disulfide reductase [Candidatus Latescibacteria bacterium]|nr:TlpA family protein disulfide reductase [Candidatus Latescibacterota bacterium]